MIELVTLPLLWLSSTSWAASDRLLDASSRDAHGARGMWKARLRFQGSCHRHGDDAAGRKSASHVTLSSSSLAANLQPSPCCVAMVVRLLPVPYTATVQSARSMIIRKDKQHLPQGNPRHRAPGSCNRNLGPLTSFQPPLTSTTSCCRVSMSTLCGLLYPSLYEQPFVKLTSISARPALLECQ